MEYLTGEEILNDSSDLSLKLKEHKGKGLKDNFAFKVFKKAVGFLEQDNPEIKVLDVGTAGGAFVKELNLCGYRNICGVDIDNYVNVQNEKYLKEFKKTDLSWDKIPWPENFFDAAAAWCVLPHLENPFYCVREVHRVLKKGGIFVFTTPCLSSKASLAYFKKNKDFGSYKENNNHISLLPPGVIAKTILKYFDLVGTEYHFRSKIFLGWKGKIRKLIYKIAKKSGQPRFLAKRWAYNIIYILKNK